MYAFFVYISPSSGINYAMDIPVIGMLRGLISTAIGYLFGYIGTSVNPMNHHGMKDRVIGLNLEILFCIYMFWVVTHEATPNLDFSYILVSAAFVMLLNINDSVLAVWQIKN